MKTANFISLATFVAALTLSGIANAHGSASSRTFSGQPEDRKIEFPDVAGYKTLVADLHTHTVFSDGHVWPNIRVTEARYDGVDLLAITDHLEYQPHKANIPNADRNSSYNEAAAVADTEGVTVVAGAEITREFPTGHINAVYIEDANKLYQLDLSQIESARKAVADSTGAPVDTVSDVIAEYALGNFWPVEQALAEAEKQDAFVFWNHSWSARTKAGQPELTDWHKTMIKEGKIQGIEVVNGPEFSKEALRIALDYDLTLIGTSDIHNLIDWDYKPHLGGHRPVTLVFAKSNKPKDVKRALRQKRTVVWSGNTLIGRKAQMSKLLEASIKLVDANYTVSHNELSLTFENKSDAKFVLRNFKNYSPIITATDFELAPHSKTTIRLRVFEQPKRADVSFEIANALIETDQHPTMRFKSSVNIDN